MKIKFILTISFLLVINSLVAQSARYIISGLVRDASSGETLPFANVFLTGTTYGTVTDKEGNFELKVFERGTYELIVKFVGYDTYAQTIEFTNHEEKTFAINLTLAAVNLGSVVVTDREDEEWQANLSSFKDAFLGRTKNSKKCKILNEEQINFYYNEEKGTLEAFCNEPIKVQNDALGYTLDYYLEQFIIDYKAGYASFYGFTFYQESKKGNKVKRRFVKARDKAFYGSIEHFFRSLSADQLKEEGWKVMLAQDIDGFGRAVKAVDYDVHKQVKAGPTPFSSSLSFDGYLYITYTKEAESEAFSGTKSISLTGDKTPMIPQRSFITIIEDGGRINFEASGYVLNPVSFLTGEYWGFEKVADMLPTNFQPSINKAN